MKENLENTQNRKKQLCLPSFSLYLLSILCLDHWRYFNKYLLDWVKWIYKPNQRFTCGIWYKMKIVAVVQSPSRAQLSATPWTAARQPSLSFTISWSLLTLVSVESVTASNHLILCRPLPFLPSVFPSIRVFSSESALHIKWPKFWSFSISHSIEYSGLIFFRIDWFDLLAVQENLKKIVLCVHVYLTLCVCMHIIDSYIICNIFIYMCV